MGGRWRGGGEEVDGRWMVGGGEGEITCESADDIRDAERLLRIKPCHQMTPVTNVSSAVVGSGRWIACCEHAKS